VCYTADATGGRHHEPIVSSQRHFRPILGGISLHWATSSKARRWRWFVSPCPAPTSRHLSPAGFHRYPLTQKRPRNSCAPAPELQAAPISGYLAPFRLLLRSAFRNSRTGHWLLDTAVWGFRTNFGHFSPQPIGRATTGSVDPRA